MRSRLGLVVALALLPAGCFLRERLAAENTDVRVESAPKASLGTAH